MKEEITFHKVIKTFSDFFTFSKNVQKLLYFYNIMYSYDIEFPKNLIVF